MNASQLTMIKEAKRLLEDCSCFRGAQGSTGPQGSTIIGPQGPQGPPGTLSSFSLVGASTNALLYYDGNKPAGMSSLFYYSTTNVLQANLDIIPCVDNVYSLGSSNAGRWKDLFLGPSSLYLGYKAKVYEDVVGNVTTDTGFHGYSMITSTINIGNSVGYQISVNNQDLFAQQYNSTGPSGTLYPLLHPIGFVSTSQLTSSINGLGTLGYISSSQLISSVIGLGQIYISSSQLQSSINGLATAGFISSSQLTSSILGTQSIYVSSISLISTTQGIENLLLSTNTGLGALGYISSLQLVSTVTGIDNTLNIIQNGLGQLGYLSTTQLISTVNGLGSIYVSTSQLTSTTIALETAFISTINIVFSSTLNGLGTLGYISSSQLMSTITNASLGLQSTTKGLGTLGYISSSQLISTIINASLGLQSTTRGLGNIYISSTIEFDLGRVLRVDSVYGNDTMALTEQYAFPFSTISCAMSVASTMDCIYILPGNYNECVVFKAGVNIRGINTNSVIIQQLNVTNASTTLITMASNTRLENVSVKLTSSSPQTSSLTGILISSCQGTVKIRGSVVTVDNSEITSNGYTRVYGVWTTGYSSTIYTSADDFQQTTINTISAGSGYKCGVYGNDSNRISMRDVNIFCSDKLNNSFSGGTYIGVVTNNSNQVIDIRTSSVYGSNYVGGNTSADVSQTLGVLRVAFTDLVNKNANNNAITIDRAQTIISLGVSGALCNFLAFDAGGGHHISNNWSNSFLIPGTLSFTTVNADPITTYYPIRNAGPVLITTMGFQAAVGVGGTLSSFAVLYKNGNPVPQFTIPLTGTNTLNYLSTSTLTIQTIDSFGIFLSTSALNTAMSNPVITLTLN